MPQPAARVRYDKVATRVGEILHYVWDPIGVVRYPQARDEYDSYVPQVVEMLVQEKKKEEIAAHLSRIEKERMGLSVTSQAEAHTASVAQILIENYEWLEKRG